MCFHVIKTPKDIWYKNETSLNIVFMNLIANVSFENILKIRKINEKIFLPLQNSPIQ